MAETISRDPALHDMQDKPSSPLQKAGVEPVVDVQSASVELGGRTIWHDVKLHLGPGELLAVLGPNGAGKSTLLKAILGLLPLRAGSITVMGVAPRRARGRVGYVPQRRHFGSDVRIRGRDLVRLGLDGQRWGLPLRDLFGRGHTAAKAVRAAIELVDGSHLANRPIGELSGGEQQRLLIAQALVTQPSLLLLDEPLDSLDLVNQREVARVIRQVIQEVGTAAMLVAHDVNPLMPCVDSICYLAGGQAATGTPEEVITSEVLSRLYGADIEVLRTRDGQLIVAGQPEGDSCLDHDGDSTEEA